MNRDVEIRAIYKELSSVLHGSGVIRYAQRMEICKALYERGVKVGDKGLYIVQN